MNNRGLLDLIISLLPGLSIKERITMLKAFASEEELLLKTNKYIQELLNRKTDKNWDILEYRNKADRIDTICRMRSIKWVSWHDEDYPPLLREIYDPPSVIFYRGFLPNPQKPLLGMVGTRRPSPEGKAKAYELALYAGKAGISVVSGLALGIDAMSHRGNLAGGVPGYAVLGGGLDEVYPSTNRQLARQILDSKGALISEYPPGVHPNKWSFPARNRIISALSRSVIIVEAPEKSGALITASFALEHGKDLWVTSTGVQENRLFDKRGAVKLAEEGAQVVDSYIDILVKWNMDITPFDESILTAAQATGKEKIICSTADLLNIKI